MKTKSEEVSQLKSYALHVLSFKLRTTSELEEKLRAYSEKKDISLSLVPVVVEEFRRLGVLNDLRYAEAWIAERRRVKFKGDRVIEMELSHKGVSQDIISQAFENLKGEESSEDDAALRLLEKKFIRYKNLPQLEAKKKLTDLLVRHGFGFDVSIRLVDSLVKREYNRKSRN